MKINRIARCSGTLAAVLVSLAGARAAQAIEECPGLDPQICYDDYSICNQECPGKNGDFSYCYNTYCPEELDACLHGRLIDQYDLYPIVSVNFSRSVCTGTSQGMLATGTKWDVYQTSYNHRYCETRQCHYPQFYEYTECTEAYDATEDCYLADYQFGVCNISQFFPGGPGCDACVLSEDMSYIGRRKCSSVPSFHFKFKWRWWPWLWW
jgi:hypothetical protein